MLSELLLSLVQLLSLLFGLLLSVVQSLWLVVRLFLLFAAEASRPWVLLWLSLMAMLWWLMRWLSLRLKL